MITKYRVDPKVDHGPRKKKSMKDIISTIGESWIRTKLKNGIILC